MRVMRQPVALPEAAPDALAASRALALRIAARIRAEGGWIGFDTYMGMALYEPGLGYYAGGSRKFGAAGDFVTAPELSDLFGRCLARQCAQWFADCAHRVVEFGAGSGALAVQVLDELATLGFPETEYLIVEVSGELAARQRERIARDCPQALGRVRWLTAWPATIDGVLLANELLDAMPVRAFLRASAGAEAAADVEPAGNARAACADVEPAGNTRAACVDVDAVAPVFERGVGLRASPSADGDPVFEWSLRPAPAPFARQVRERLAQGFGAAPADPAAYAGEIGEQAEAWVAQAAQRLVRGAMLLIDYGFARREFFHAQRAMGTLMCHYRHHAHGDPFHLPGLQDITAHVDFTAVTQAATAAGLQLLGHVSQARLLTSLGLLEDLAQRHRSAGADPDPLAWARQAQAAQALLSEAEMGELFKAVAFGRGITGPADGFARGDRSAELLE